ncbi:MAG: tryptophan--tRNA ligase [Candidatus Tagabacteria bacterium CG10_big_fil_rev_8_21_14_0_10_40_13]|uniref:Tryptophan--tRNA ligase n=2 Tax=Parcubacteria group TaxID=1794811 RepID=A0A2M7UGZ4_9BACT|nr:MAG: tryptophan--tRNA ligase [Parcubacteria group bacterium CG1_02_40_25]PIZ70487.1 MAG: tryptophan--tRNA ligase [Candidatus Portnoybacteria bacterium CG_4_10_14_0_2_um_filter_39_11]PJE73399.1 MAG: tryptophan--tRNA ligase [Candidatus Tagabacteria bacterium CG10_big_fil_rev_8_21_14_0_10_40_13]
MSKISMKKRILTGDRPTGSLHIGHYVGSLENRVRLQDEYECFFIIADYQVLTDHLRETEKISKNILEIAIDWLSVGMDPQKSAFFVQSKIPEIAELTMYFSMLVTIPRLQRNPTVKEEVRATRLGKTEMTYGFLGYPVSQAADILSVRADLVPAGADQQAHVEQTRDIAQSFNKTFGRVFPMPKALLGEFPRLSGIDGQKMSKSRNNAIFLKDSPDEVARKVMKIYTDPTRIHATDPGHIRGNIAFAYLDAFDKDGAEVRDLKEKYRKGKIGDVAVKQRLIEVLNKFLDPIRERRRELESNPNLVRKAIISGTHRTQKEAAETLKLVRNAMHFDYDEIFSG